jgi:hypothetical protein
MAGKDHPGRLGTAALASPETAVSRVSLPLGAGSPDHDGQDFARKRRISALVDASCLSFGSSAAVSSGRMRLMGAIGVGPR